jgi:hypothetical protein
MDCRQNRTRMTATLQVTRANFNCGTKWGSKWIDKACLKEFWSALPDGSKHGVYVFGIKAAKGWKPLYVGQAKKQSLRARIRQHIDGGHFNAFLKGTKKGIPVVFLVARVGKGKKSNYTIDNLETEFINYAFDRNPHLRNDRKVKKPVYRVVGFGGPGSGSGKLKKDAAEL